MPRRSTRKRTKKRLPDQDSDEEYETKRKPRRPPSPPTPPPPVSYDDDEDQEEDEEEQQQRQQKDLDDQEDEQDQDPFAAEEEDEEEADDEEQEQQVTYRGRGRGRAPIILRLVVPKQPPSNLYCGPAENVDKLELPLSSQDLLIQDGKQLMQALSIYEILRHFGYIIRLSPFRFEDFCTSLLVDEQSNLLSEIHIQLLRTCIREDKQQQTWIVPAELRDSINVYLHLSDTFDWPAALRLYLSADERENGTILDALHAYKDYPFNVDLKTKLDVLQQLCNQFLLSSFAREDIVNGGVIKHDDMCRLCYKPGELIPCDSCSAAYHALCADPPVDAEEEALEKPWNCPVCQVHRVKGVTDCIDPVEKSGFLKRQDMLGWDRHGRRYWFLSRRIFVVDENEEDVRYYSTRKQFEELLSCIGGDHHEKYLSENLTELKEHILSQMEITEDLYNSLRAWRKSYVDLAHMELDHRTNKAKGLTNGNDLYIKNELDDVDLKTIKGEVKEEKPTLEEMHIKKENGGDITMNGDDSCDFKKSFVINENDNTCSSMVSIKTESEAGTNHVKSEHDPTLMSDDDSRSQDATTIDDPLAFAQDGVLLDSCNAKGANALNQSKSRNSSGVSNASDTPTTVSTRHATRFSTSSTPQTGHKEDYTLVQDAQTGSIAKISKKSLVLDDLRSNTYLFKLGLESTYKHYQNQFTVNPLALNKHQHSDNDPNRSLGNKFSINSGSAFKWHGAITGSRCIMPSTIRATLLKFESLLPKAFMHPNWSCNRSKWIRSVNVSMSEMDFANALSVLESSIKPVLFRIAWIDNLGTLSLHRTTFLEREELKKTDRQPRGFERREYLSADFEMSIRLGTAVKFSSKLKPVKHKVWKQKGEEYRLTGLNGWSWLSSTFRSRPTKQPKSYQNTSFKYLEPIHSDSTLTENVQRIINESEVIDVSENLKSEDSKRFLYTKRAMEFKKLKKVEELYRVVEHTKSLSEIAANQKPSMQPTGRSTLSSTRNAPRIMNGRLPKCHDFLTYRGKVRSLLVLPKVDLSQLARVGGMRETRGFSYNAKQNNYVWPYGITPRPVFRTCWLYKNRIASSMHEVALQLRILYACVRWEDLQARPPASGNNVIITDDETVTIELLKRRDKPPYYIRSDYLIRKTVVPIEQPTKYRKVGKSSTPSARSGLRTRRRQDDEEERAPTTTELWVPEEHLELWELKQFDEKMERVNQLAKEKAIREEAERKRLAEDQARRARLAAAQQKRNSTITQQPPQTGPRILPTTPIIHRTTPIIVNKSMRPLFITFRPSSATPTSGARTFIINMPRNATAITLPPNMRFATATAVNSKVITTPGTGQQIIQLNQQQIRQLQTQQAQALQPGQQPSQPVHIHLAQPSLQQQQPPLPQQPTPQQQPPTEPEQLAPPQPAPSQPAPQQPAPQQPQPAPQQSEQPDQPQAIQPEQPQAIQQVQPPPPPQQGQQQPQQESKSVPAKQETPPPQEAPTQAPVAAQQQPLVPQDSPGPPQPIESAQQPPGPQHPPVAQHPLVVLQPPVPQRPPAPHQPSLLEQPSIPGQPLVPEQPSAPEQQAGPQHALVAEQPLVAQNPPVPQEPTGPAQQASSGAVPPTSVQCAPVPQQHIQG